VDYRARVRADLGAYLAEIAGEQLEQYRHEILAAAAVNLDKSTAKK
jgi:hypothetical protein